MVYTQLVCRLPARNRLDIERELRADGTMDKSHKNGGIFGSFRLLNLYLYHS